MRRRLRVALFSHDSLGLGHIRRNRALAFALARDLPALTGREVSGLLIASSPEAARFDLPDGWDWVILPGVTPAPGGYVPRALASSMQGLRALRARTDRHRRRHRRHGRARGDHRPRRR